MYQLKCSVIWDRAVKEATLISRFKVHVSVYCPDSPNKSTSAVTRLQWCDTLVAPVPRNSSLKQSATESPLSRISRMHHYVPQCDKTVSAKQSIGYTAIIQSVAM